MRYCRSEDGQKCREKKMRAVAQKKSKKSNLRIYVNKVNWYVIFVVRRMQFQFISIYDNIQVGSNQPSINRTIYLSIHPSIFFWAHLAYVRVSNSLLRFQYLFLNKWMADVHTKTEYWNRTFTTAAAAAAAVATDALPQTIHVHTDKLRFQRNEKETVRRHRAKDRKKNCKQTNSECCRERQ